MKKSKCKTHVVPVSKCAKGVAIDSFCIYQDKNIAVYVESEVKSGKVISVSVRIYED